ncbi:myo-inositol 2-dehydrogenase/D-chiro-inositol 1-dehydrogenase [Kribbella rubisoli]|uniref:Myo-inositol 2-dehydrogenase/D-chiro-inositol 1-dehydrogenase n=1 Tax=Kribbella rubisoli TaxID=3075929 RepID=A0A4Q7WNV0_9ACTN|nr:Gfo/Idh/MocA family oxidoreductase [Kribbella rubisoli]RZU11383.1 myo-inositol 2-dehydrogenase/D-chiro-inositol 1-dehydrogenase [Kribbella rubisoli]
MSYVAVEVHPHPNIHVGVVGVGWMGRFHATTVAEKVPGLVLEAIADPDEAATTALARRLGVRKVTADAATVFSDPAVDAVIIASPPRFHPVQMKQASAAGQAIFCEKPAGLNLPDLDAGLAEVARAETPLQIGFNRRYSAGFSRAHQLVCQNAVGTPHLLRSLTRDPAPLVPETIKRNAIFIETLIHDFDMLNWFNSGSVAIDVRTVADALIRPDYASTGFLDTALVTIRYDNGALATAEASLQTSYGYDVRLEVFGPDGMVTAGGAPQPDTRWYGAHGSTAGAAQRNIEIFHDAYVAELTDFRDLVRAWRAGRDLAEFTAGRTAMAGGNDVREALAIAQAAIDSHESGTAVAVEHAATEEAPR